jgi:hypothetical protein
MIWLAGVVTHAVILNLAYEDSVTQSKAIAELTAKQEGCRIFLLGSSGVLTGLSASELTRQTGCAVGNASGGLLGRRFANYLPRLLKTVRPGDVVVLSDRCWTGITLEANPCFSQPLLATALTGIRMVPNLAAHFRASRSDPASSNRSAVGDILVFPASESRQPLTETLQADKLSDGVTLARRQLELIHSTGAIAILAGQPLFVAQAQKALIQNQVTSWSVDMQRQLGGFAWVAPWVDDDPRYFAMEGQHLSEMGRTRWTAMLAKHIRLHAHSLKIHTR